MSLHNTYVVFSIQAFQSVFVNTGKYFSYSKGRHILAKRGKTISSKLSQQSRTWLVATSMTYSFVDISIVCMPAVTWSRSWWPSLSYSSPPAPFLFFLGLLHHKDRIRHLWWSWPRLRRLHDLKPCISEGKWQGSFNTLVIFQSLVLPPPSEQLWHPWDIKMLKKIFIQFSLFFPAAFFKQRIFRNFTAQDKIRNCFKELTAEMVRLQERRHKEICQNGKGRSFY